MKKWKMLNQLVFTTVYFPRPQTNSQPTDLRNPLWNKNQKMCLYIGHQGRGGLDAKLYTSAAIDVGRLCNEGRLKEAIDVLHRMGEVDSGTYVSILQTCVYMKAKAQGKRVHAHAIKTGFELDIDVGAKLVLMYAKCKSHISARQVFDKMPERNLVTWTAMIGGYSQNGCGKDALKLFSQMKEFGMRPNQFTFGTVLSACAGLEALEEGKQVHGYTIKTGLESNVFVGSALVDMYAKCGRIHDAHQVFDKMPDQNVVAWTAMITGYVKNEKIEEASNLFWEMPDRNVISWNAMISGYAQTGHGEEALRLFSQMQWAGPNPNQSTFPSVLSACASLAALGKGKYVHAYIIKAVLKPDVFVGNALTAMYAKCGSIEDARQVFDRMAERNVVSWNAVISGYALHGQGKEALELFEQMQCAGTKPNDVTFLCVLAACNHAGLVDEGRHYFYSMFHDHGITPRVEHFACMVDLLGRAGHLGEAEDFIKNVPLEPDAGLWKALLGACRIHANTEIAQRAAAHLFQLEAEYTPTYVLLSNIYAEAGRWDDVAKVRRMMKDRGFKKTAGCSQIEVKNRVHNFVIGDRTHPQTEEIYAMLEKLSGRMKEGRYVPDINFVLNDVQG